MTPAVLSMTPSAPGRIRTRDPLLRRSFHAGGQAAAFLFRAGLLVVWLQLNVCGFRPVLARTWHATWVQTTGTALLAAVSADWYEQEHRQGTVDPDPSLVRHCHRVGCNALNRTRGSAGRPLLFFRPADQSPRPPPRLSLPPPAGERLPYPLRRQEALAYAGVRPIWHAPRVTAVIAGSLIFSRSPSNVHGPILCSAQPAWRRCAGAASGSAFDNTGFGFPSTLMTDRLGNPAAPHRPQPPAPARLVREVRGERHRLRRAGARHRHHHPPRPPVLPGPGRAGGVRPGGHRRGHPRGPGLRPGT